VRVEVLLATHNGEKFITEFLESLADQKDVEIDLVVSDDNSSDHTIQIVNSFADKFHSLKILTGPNKGAKNNFVHLIQNSNSEFSAFADQDDIWLQNHLKDSVNRLATHVGTPALVFSKVIEFSESAQNREWPVVSSNPELAMLLTENLARGCTIVMNSELINLLKKSDFSEIYMHDWWAILVAKTCGAVEFINTSGVKYRIHRENVVGSRKPFKVRMQLFCRSYFLNKEWIPRQQTFQLLAQYGGFMTDHDKSLVNTFANLGVHNLKRRYSFLYRQNIVFRQSKFENHLLKLVLLLSPLVRSK
jgi:glycosyltransferase involved in cell wall biosynthesis